MAGALFAHLFLAAVTVRVNLRPERIHEPAVGASPDRLGRLPAVETFLEQLQQLPRGVDIAEPGGEHAVIEPLTLVLGEFRPGLGDEIVEPNPRQPV